MSSKRRMGFTEWLKLCEAHGAPAEIREAMVFVHDTLDAADVIAESIFGKHEDDIRPSDERPSDETVLAVYDRIVKAHQEAQRWHPRRAEPEDDWESEDE